MLQKGDVIGGTYEVVRHLASGGQSHVCLVRRRGDTARGAPLWIAKEVRTDGAFTDALAHDMLRAEIDVLRRLEHRGLLRVDDAVREDGRLYMIAEFVEGETLEDVIKKRGALPEETVYDIALQLCDVLGYLHSRRRAVCYRDLKPANIILQRDGSVVLIDFGTAMLSGRAFRTDRTPMGTKGFAAPEQYGGADNLSDGTDVYAMGKTLIALLSGGKTTLRSVRNVTPVFLEILKGCTRRSRARRYRTVADVYIALRSGKAKTRGIFAEREVRRSREACAVNGAFRIGKQMQIAQALSYKDIEIPLDDAMTDVQIALDSNAVRVVETGGLTLERDVMVSMRENYYLG